MTAVGVCALQGDFSAHERLLSGLGAEVHEVRRPAQLAGLAGLVIPGGESTALLYLMDHDPAWWPELEAFHTAGKALFGTCAGLILVAREVTPAQRSRMAVYAAYPRFLNVKLMRMLDDF